MAPPSARPTTEALLAHVEWVRRLARLLVANEHDAADVEQETWRQALERPPRHAGALRQWLAAVVRNVARKSVRAQSSRDRRERDAATTASAIVSASTSATTSPAHDVTARAELHRRVVDAVLTLEEIYRAPLLLRFFDDLSAVEVAARLSVPVETARTRIKRGLALLRARLGGEFGTDGREGIAALAPLLWAGGKAPIAVATASAGVGGASTLVGSGIVGMVVGGAFMSKFAKLAVGIVVAALACFGTYKVWLEPRPEGDRATKNANQPPELPPPATAPALPKPAPAAAAATREAVERAAPEKPTAPVALGTIDGTVMDAAARPVAGAKVVVDRRANSGLESLRTFRARHGNYDHEDPGHSSFKLATSAADGSFHFDGVDPSHQWAIGALHDPRGTGWTDQVAFEGTPANARVVVTLEAGVVVFGVVRDPLGQPVAAANVNFDGAMERQSGDFDFWGALSDSVYSAEDGSYRTIALPWRFVRMHVLAEYRKDLSQLLTKSEELPPGVVEVRRDLTVPALTTLRGRILGPDGQPARLNQTVIPKLGADAARVQTRATLAVAAFAADPRQKPQLLPMLGTNDPDAVFLDADHLYGKLVVGEDRYELPLRSALLRYVAVIARNRVLGVAEIPTPPSAPDVVIDASLVPEQSLIHGLRLHFRDGGDGKPLEGVQLEAMTITSYPNGQLGMEILHLDGKSGQPANRDVELPRMPCTLLMRHEGFARRTASIDASRSGAPTELTIDFAPSAGPLVVHLVDEGHVPIAGGFVRVVRAADHEAIMVEGSDATDEHGECRLRGVPAGELLVVVLKPGFAAAGAKVTAGEDGDNPVDVMMAKGYEVTVDAHHADGRAAEDGQISITDESGAPLYDHFDLAHAGPTRLFHTKFRLTDGTYTVRCLIPGGEGGSTKFVAAPGAIVEVALAPVH